MMRKNIVKPIGLKGQENVNRIIHLMGESVSKNTNNSVIELSKIGPDGKVYGIVRENHEYYIKTVGSGKRTDLVVEDFNYIGGLQNKKREVYPSYAKAIKQLNLKFLSLNEAFSGPRVNVFENDKLDYNSNNSVIVETFLNKSVEVNESNVKIGHLFLNTSKSSSLKEDVYHEGGDRSDDVRLVIDKLNKANIEVNLYNVLIASLFLPAGEFSGDEEGMVEDVINQHMNDIEQKRRENKNFWANDGHNFNMSEDEELIDRMVEGLDPIVEKRTVPKLKNLKISKAISIEEEDDKLSSLVESLSPSEATALINALKKKV